MKINDIKIRNIAYAFAIALVVLLTLNYLVAQFLSISPADVNAAKKSVELKELANQIHFSTKILIRCADVGLDMQKETVDLAQVRAKYEKIRFLLHNGAKDMEERNMKINVAPATDERLATLIELQKDWKEYDKDLRDLNIRLNRAELSLKDSISDTKDLQWVNKKYIDFLQKNEKLVTEYNEFLEKKRNSLNFALFFVATLVLLVMGGIYYAVRNLFLNPINTISRSSRELAKGNLSEQMLETSRSEIGYIAQNVNDLANILKNATEFSREIGQGNLDVAYKGITDENQGKESIVGALQIMRDQLRKIAEKDRQDRWSNAGLAKFADVLRINPSDTIEIFCYNVISNLVNYLEATQGAVFIINDDKPNKADHYLEAKAAYAMNKKKFLEKKIEIGEGQIGQAFRDAEMIYISDVPDTYEKVTSALGSTRPKNVLIVPLETTEGTIGVLELLSLKDIPRYRLTFVQRVVDAISVAINTIKKAEKSRKMAQENEEMDKRISRRN